MTSNPESIGRNPAPSPDLRPLDHLDHLTQQTRGTGRLPMDSVTLVNPGTK